MTDKHPDPPDVIDLAVGCVRSVESAIGVPLDFTQDTLPLVDHYLKLVMKEEKRTADELIAPMCGAYFGEVLRRELGEGEWCAEGAPDDWRIELRHVFLAIKPIAVVSNFLAGRGEQQIIHVLPQSKPDVQAALDGLGEEPGATYLTLSVQFEAIETAREALRRTAGKVHRIHDHSSYETFFDSSADKKTLH